MNRSPLPSRSVGLARTTTLKRNSPLARKAMARQPAVRRSTATKTGDWSEETREALKTRSGSLCEICGCNPGTDAHHRRKRSTRDHRVVNGLWLCRTCHQGAHSHPTEAREYGWIVPTWEQPEDVPLLVNGNRWVRLEPNGTYRTHADSYPDVA